jgi:hypothetical protein
MDIWKRQWRKVRRVALEGARRRRAADDRPPKGAMPASVSCFLHIIQSQKVNVGKNNCLQQ